MVTHEKVKKYMWSHIDFGKSQVCAKFLGEVKHKHGDIIEFNSYLNLLGNGIKIGDEPRKYKGVFRLIETNLYREALPIAKEIYDNLQH